MQLLRHALARLRGDALRAMATMLSVAIAVTAFVVLTGSAEVQRLEVTRTVEENFRGSYDVLVRPAGIREPLEVSSGLVRSTFLSGVHGGITLAQVESIHSIGGVETAAPFAMVGTTFHRLQYSLDVTDLLPGSERMLLRYSAKAHARNGHIEVPGAQGFLYLSRQPFTSEHIVEVNGTSRYEADRLTENVDGSRRYPCAAVPAPSEDEPSAYWEQRCASLAGGNDATGQTVVRDGRVYLPITLLYPVQIAAIDPVEEAKLVGLDGAVTAGRYLQPSDTWTPGVAPLLDDRGRPPFASALLAGSLDADYTLDFTIDLLPPDRTEAFLDLREGDDLAPTFVAAASASTLGEPEVTASDLHSGFLADFPPSDTLTSGAGGWRAAVWLNRVLRPSAVEFTAGTPLRPTTQDLNETALGSTWGMPGTVADTAFRTVSVIGSGEGGSISWTSGCVDPNRCWDSVLFNVVGHFDPARVRQPGALGGTPLEEYTAARLVAGDEASRVALGSDAYRSDLNPAGYAQLPPSVLIPLDALPMLSATQLQVPVEALVSAVRVRVAGVTGMDAASRERIRLVAEQIRAATGLDVDITVGSSQTAQRVELPATRLGVPALNLDELWTKLGVAVTITTALDAKSVLLFALILVSASLTVAATANAAVATRRKELGTLACLGWRPGRLRREVLLELLLLGSAAGAVGAALSWPASVAFGAPLDPWRLAASVPIAIAVTLLAGLAATRMAGRTAPIDALRPPAIAPRRRLRSARSVRTPAGMGVRLALARPARFALGAASVALATGSLTLLVGILVSFRVAVVGSFLGDAVALQVRGADLIAAGCLVVLGLVTVGTILLLGVREDAVLYATLRAVGWRNGAIAAVLASQAALIGLVGGVLGGAASAGALWALNGALETGTVGVAAAVASAGVLGAACLAVVPAAMLRRVPAARILSGE